MKSFFYEQTRPKKFDNDIKFYALFGVKLKSFSIPKSIKLKSNGIKVSPSSSHFWYLINLYLLRENVDRRIMELDVRRFELFKNYLMIEKRIWKLQILVLQNYFFTINQ